MATAYHLEVLRRQRVIDRAEAARERVGEKQLEAKVGEPKPGGSRNSSANSTKKSQESQHTTPNRSRASTAEANNSKRTTPDQSPAASPTSRHTTASQSRASTATGSKGSKPPSAAGSKPPSAAGSGKESKPPSAAGSKGSRPPSTAEESKPSSTGHSRGSVNREDSPHHEHCHSPARESHSQSRSSTAADSKEATSGKILSRPTTPDRKAEAVRNDLHKQEVLLRDSNLVMGKVSTAEEMDVN